MRQGWARQTTGGGRRFADYDLDDFARPLVGGLQIRAEGAGKCTLGFLAKRNGFQGMVINSHCTDEGVAPDGGDVFQPEQNPIVDFKIGVEVVDPTPFAGTGAMCDTQSPPVCCAVGDSCRFADAAWILSGLATPTPRHGLIAMPSPGSTSWTGYDFFAIAGVQGPYVGQAVSKVGKTTGLTNGHVTATNVNIRGSHLPGEPMLLYQHRADYERDSGDSGSPVFYNINGFDVLLEGIHWGFSGSGEAIFSDVQYAQWELGSLDVKFPSSGGGGR